MDDAVAIVSGGAEGLGQAFAARLAEEGYRVLAFDIKPQAYQHDGVTFLMADIRSRGDVEDVVATATEMGALNIVVNNAGVWRRTPVDSEWQQTLADWDEIMDTNLKGTMMLSRAAIPYLKDQGGHIINVSTYYVLPARSPGTNQPDTDLYNASKWALNGFTDAWSKSLAKYDITVNGMSMAAVDTPMLRGFFPNGVLPDALQQDLLSADELAQQLLDIIASGRSGENFGAWNGEPVSIGTPPPPHQRITGVTDEPL